MKQTFGNIRECPSVEILNELQELAKDDNL